MSQHQITSHASAGGLTYLLLRSSVAKQVPYAAESLKIAKWAKGPQFTLEYSLGMPSGRARKRLYSH